MSDERWSFTAAGRVARVGWSRGAVVMAVALLGLSAACARPKPPAARPTAPVVAGPPGKLPRAAFYVPGEVMEFEVTFRGVALGRAVLVAGEPGVVNGRHAIIVRSEIESTGLGKLVKVVRDDMRTWIDLSTGGPMKHQADMLFGEDTTVQESRFAGRSVIIDYTRNRTGKRKQTYLMPAGEIAHDSHTVLGAVRAWHGKPGESVTFHGLNGRRMWRGTLKVMGHETIRTAMGLYPAIKLQGTATRLTSRLKDDPKGKPRTLTIWLSDDPNRLPLRIEGNTEHGQVQMEMTRYRQLEAN